VIDPLLVEVDKIFHLACPASPSYYQLNPIKTMKTSFLGTFNMLGLAKRVDATILFASTSEVYGDPLEHPQTETYLGNVNPIGERSCYDEGKRAAEALVYSYKRKTKVVVRVARIFNCYGPRMRSKDGRLVSNFISRALAYHPLQIYGNGKTTRSLQYVDDLIIGLILLMDSNYDQPINLGNPQELTLDNFRSLTSQIIGSDSNQNSFTYVDAVIDDPGRRKPSITLARRKLGWEPRWSLLDGLAETVYYMRRSAACQTTIGGRR
jgi:UDP-glucuronate decarboxylase